MSKRPVIGITLDREDPGGYSKFPWYAVRENYATSVAETGGLPMALPAEPGMTEAFLDEIDGLVITGGHFDVDPGLFGDETTHETVKLKQKRTDFEFAVTKGALARDMPVFGICGGQQLLHVVLGGKLIQHIPDEVANALAHEQPNPRNEPGHTVAIKKDTLLYDIVGVEEMNVNSAHHQAAKDAPDGVVINATAPDGVIEGMEAPKYKFCLGVQWHPEFFIDPGDRKLFEAFIRACS